MFSIDSYIAGKSFLKRLLKKSPKDRSSADKSLQHRWITERNDKSEHYRSISLPIHSNLEKSLVV
jgi:serine/threonine protein kinase